MSGAFQVGARRTLPLPVQQAWALVTSPAGMAAWLGEPAPALVPGAPYRLDDGTDGEVRVVSQPGGPKGPHLRLTRQPGGWPRPATVQVRCVPAAGDRTTVAFHEEHLPGPAERTARRAHYLDALDTLEAAAAAPIVEGPGPGDPAVVESILRALPQWFGIEESLLAYARGAVSMPTFTAKAGGRTIGFLCLEEHFPEAAELYVMGVLPAHRRLGVGAALVRAAEDWLRAKGCRVLQVKTLSASREHEPYAQTRAFYRALGFIPLEELPELWSPANPCLVSVKPLK